MIFRRIAVVGASGFVGRHLLSELVNNGIKVRAISRRPDLVKRQSLYLGLVDWCHGNVVTGEGLAEAFAGVDAVINLSGALVDSKRNHLDKVNAMGPANIVAAMRQTGVKRLVHVSALGADSNSESRYFQSKGMGERAALVDDLDVTVLRPSLIFGSGDSTITRFARMARMLPVMPMIGCGTVKMQPIWAEDVVTPMIQCLDQRKTFGQTYDLGGPEVFTMRQILTMTMAAAIGKQRPILPIPLGMADLLAGAVSFLPGKILTSEMVDGARVDSVCSDNAMTSVFGLKPRGMTWVLPTYIGQFDPYHRDRMLHALDQHEVKELGLDRTKA
ncbi:MAG: hypothetical protein COX57_07370 [Alphaproteobacteria bacterium CG_4_10_14_0_2_um_filter_63_37]|nr:MAG: hypothetical protein AUJ55_02180 [Proteobacteria bacterium CG1_02_64_396]PJA24694.1 MAG: hypothetical protein COX57_07370 [Alphaproteobacteria bacterium CG_4_10_14_0_2_um_filter_63_37]